MEIKLTLEDIEAALRAYALEKLTALVGPVRLEGVSIGVAFDVNYDRLVEGATVEFQHLKTR